MRSAKRPRVEATITLLGETKDRDTPIRVEVGDVHIVDGKPEAAFALLQHTIAAKPWEQNETIRLRTEADFGELEPEDEVLVDGVIDQGASAARRRNRFLELAPAAIEIARVAHVAALDAVAAYIDSLPKPPEPVTET